MYNYLSALYDNKTLLSVSAEIIKLSKGGGAGRISKIAKYVISAIGVALAVALAVFIQSQQNKSHQTTHHPSHHPTHSNEPPHYLTYDEIYPNAPKNPPSYDDLYGPEPSAPPEDFIPAPSAPPLHEREANEYIYGTHSSNVGMNYQPHYTEPVSTKHTSTHKIDVFGGKHKRRKHHKLY
jgi:hypothetical protein